MGVMSKDEINSTLFDETRRLQKENRDLKALLEAQKTSDLQQALGSIHSYLALSSNERDWSSNAFDAWLYGIVCGWSESVYKELAKKYDWHDVHIEQNQKFHKAYMNVFK